MAAVWTLSCSFDLPQYVGPCKDKCMWVCVCLCNEVSDAPDAIKQISEYKLVQVGTWEMNNTSVKLTQAAFRKSLNSQSCTVSCKRIKHDCRRTSDI